MCTWYHSSLLASSVRCWALFFKWVLAPLPHSPRHVPMEGNLNLVIFLVSFPAGGFQITANSRKRYTA